MNKSFWKWILAITLLSLVSTIIFGSDIPWENLSECKFSWVVAKEILYDVSVGVLSSMILVWCIDRIVSRETEKQEKKQRMILYRKLEPIIKNYYDFYLFLYIATRDTPVPIESNVTQSLYLCKDEFVQQIKDTNPFYKDGYYGDESKINFQMQLLTKCVNDSDEAEKVMNMCTSLPWYKCWSIDGTKFYDKIFQIERDFPTFFSNELLEMIEELLQIVSAQKNMVKFVEGGYLSELNIMKDKMLIFPTEFFIENYKIVDILRLLDSIMEYIENDSNITLRKREISFFNERNVVPTIGYSCSKSNKEVL